MKNGFTFKTFAVALAWLCIASSSAGLTLGRVQGLAIIGQPLDVRVPVQFDTSEDAQSACLNAEVVYGDWLLDSTRVSVAVESKGDATSRPVLIRVRTSVAVNEPVVTVNLRSGCQIRTSRGYTLLAELPTQVVELPPVRQPATEQLPAPSVQAVASAPMVIQRRERVAQAASRPAAPQAVKPTVALAQAPQAAGGSALPVRAPKPTKSTSRARLKLDPLDLMIERDPVLRATDELVSLPEEGAQDGPTPPHCGVRSTPVPSRF